MSDDKMKDIVLDAISEVDQNDSTNTSDAIILGSTPPSAKESVTTHSTSNTTYANTTAVSPNDIKEMQEDEEKKYNTEKSLNNEIDFLYNLREKLLVLFEGLQNNEIKNLDKKLNMTLNFLEYELALLEERISIIKG